MGRPPLTHSGRRRSAGSLTTVRSRVSDPADTVRDMAELVPDDYASTLEELKQHVHHARFKAQRAANTELLRLYWRIGRTILDRQAQQAWGSEVLQRLAADLRAEFPTMKGFS